MGMTLGGKSSQRAEINVTPMIDVLLVLIIIFMVITPTVPQGLQTAIPRQDSQEHGKGLTHDIVISVGKDRGLQLNQEPIEIAALESRLKSLYRAGAANYIFVRGDRDLNFSDVVSVIDLARGAGWDRIGLMTQ